MDGLSGGMDGLSGDMDGLSASREGAAASARILLPGRAEPLEIGTPGWAASYPPPASRRVYAAAHVAARPTPGGPVIDWESTLRFRDHLWAHGFGVAEAMDTAQRGMGLSWEQARELIARSAARAGARNTAERDRAERDRAAGNAASGASAARDGGGSHGGGSHGGGSHRGGSHGGGSHRGGSHGGAGGGAASSVLACGVGTDQLPAGDSHPLGEIIRAYEEQLALVRSHKAGVILMASRALAATARGPRDYLEVYGALLKQADQPVILHWLGEAFDPALRGYWGGADFGAAAATVLELAERHGDKVDGIKLSVLDESQEVWLRRRLPRGVRLYTGDDFNYAALIRGDERGHSDALLGTFAAIAAPAAAALHALDAGDVAGYDAAMTPTIPLSRLIFEQPTFCYKTGVAFLAWLNGLQPHFVMLGGLERRRTAGHLIGVFELAARAGALAHPALAVGRMNEFLAAAA